MTSPNATRNTASELNPREIRRSLGLNQADFWSRIGVTQSGGSRYESGRAMPRPVRELLRVVHVEGVDLARVRREDVELLEHLKACQPALYESLRASLDEARGLHPADGLPPAISRLVAPTDLGTQPA
jgi:transcriptional regulator with XRE-family HTH domain